MSTVLEVKDLETRFETHDGTVYAVNGISFNLNEGETLGVVGESGCGKSVTMLSLLGLIPRPPGKIAAGQALFYGKDLLKMSEDELRGIRGGQISMIFQDPMTSLNPVLTIGDQIQEALIVHLNMTPEEARERAVQLLKLVGISDGKARLNDYPFQFSGGMRQRVMIAMALACTPKILIADEPTTALDVTIQAQIIELVKGFRQDLGMSILWITHDLGIIAGLAHRVMVMYAGFIVERALVDDLYERPLHPYTRGLLGSLPRVDAESGKDLVNIEGMPPALLSKPTGCPFAPRCRYAFSRCTAENPSLVMVEKSHEVACWWNIEEDRPRYGHN
jgi:oligopeptide transport system ATP-binding protein